MRPSKKPELIPDDVEDLKAFATAVTTLLTEKRAARVVEDFIISSMQVTALIDAAKDHPDMEQMGRTVGLAALVQLYKFLKHNEHALKSLCQIGLEGEPFLYDQNRD